MIVGSRKTVGVSFSVVAERQTIGFPPRRGMSVKRWSGGLLGGDGGGALLQEAEEEPVEDEEAQAGAWQEPNADPWHHGPGGGPTGSERAGGRRPICAGAGRPKAAMAEGLWRAGVPRGQSVTR